VRPLVQLSLLVAVLTPVQAAAADDIPIELHFKPVPGVQIAVWLEDKGGNFVGDLFVTQATGKLGIGNRPGLWNFLSSWRAPYGPRPSVLPVWAHRRAKTYPKLVFHDPFNDDSLGFHEATSSAENYYCRPLSPAEHDVIAVDTMTCPSPNVFKTDKGEFDGDNTSVYPPRNDILEVSPNDAAEVAQFADINDLDAVTAATPIGDKPEYITAMIPAELVAHGPLTAWIEVSLEHDENAAHDYDRDKDHYVDPSLSAFGVEYLGQPSVVYKVQFDPRAEGFLGTSDYAGYGDWDGKSGALHPPDATISSSDGSGADRLRQYTLNDETFRFGVYSYGEEGVVDPTGDDESSGSSGDDSASGSSDDGPADDDGTNDDDDGGGWGHCRPRELASVAGMSLEGMSFDKVRVHYTIPAQDDPEFELYKFHVYSLTGETALTIDNVGSAFEHPIDLTTIAAPGEAGTIQLEQLWGNYTYQIGVTYEDRCGNTSPLATAAITTPAQKFQQVDGLCFLATAAYGAPWTVQVQALRWFRDAYLKTSPLGVDVVRFYYTHSPPLAAVVRRQPLLRGMVRVVLQPITDAVRLGP
jgi:hypothetical protein